MQRLLAALLLAASSFAGCAMLEPPATGPLVTVETRGGECPEGACGNKVVIGRDGSVQIFGPMAEARGPVSQTAMAALDAAIRSADFAAIMSKPFTGECPVNFDGQEVIFTFETPSGSQRIASCQVEIDGSHPLFVAVQTAMDSAN